MPAPWAIRSAVGMSGTAWQFLAFAAHSEPELSSWDIASSQDAAEFEQEVGEENWTP